MEFYPELTNPANGTILGGMAVALNGKHLTVEEAAAKLGLAVASVRRYCNLTPPKIKGTKQGRDWFIPIEEVNRFKKEKRPMGRPPKAAI